MKAAQTAWPPCSCGSPSMHYVSRGDERRYFCCGCYIADGGTPADWHRLCKEAWEKRRREYGRVVSRA